MSAFEGRPYELRKAGVKLLMDGLGDEDAREFLTLWRGIPGRDFNKWLNAQPEKSMDELEAEIMRLQEADAELVGA